MNRLNRLTLCFSNKLRNLEAAFAMFAAYYNYLLADPESPESRAKSMPLTAATMAGLTDHLWSFDEFFNAVMAKHHF